MDVEILASLASDGPDHLGREIHEGPAAVEATLAAFEQVAPAVHAANLAASRIVLVGTGASLEMALAAAPAWRTAARARGDRRPLVVREASAVAFGSDGEALEAADFVIVVSYRGTSPETVAAARLARNAGCAVAAVTRDAPSPLAGAVDLVVELACGAEEKGAATKSELATLAALQAMGGVLPADAALRAAVRLRLQRAADDWPAAAAFGPALARAGQVWFVGFGPGHGIARAGHLLWHEKARRIAAAPTLSEYRHGPVEAARPGDVVLLVDTAPSTPAQAGYLDLLEAELATLDCRAIRVGPGVAPDHGLATEDRGPVGSLEALLRVQQVVRAAVHAGGWYAEEFRALGTVVRPSPDLA